MLNISYLLHVKYSICSLVKEAMGHRRNAEEDGGTKTVEMYRYD